MPTKKPDPAHRPASRRAPGDPAAASARRQRAEPPPTADIPTAELTPRVESAVTRLMRELDRLKDDLLSAQERVNALETVADEDALVPVLNRRGFHRELDRVLAYRKRYGGAVSLVFMDLDDFKAVNDTYGHAAGDAVLRHVALLLLANVRRSDLVGRIGGDEFALVLHHADQAAAQAKTDRLTALVGSVPVTHDGQLIPVGLSAGVAELTDFDTTATALRRADRAMYANKEERRRRV